MMLDGEFNYLVFSLIPRKRSGALPPFSIDWLTKCRNGRGLRLALAVFFRSIWYLGILLPCRVI
jgi:hypothetical protein